MRITTLLSIFLSALVLILPSFAMAADNLAHPTQLGMLPAATPSATEIHNFHHLLMYIITGIVAFVTVLLVYVMIRFNAKSNPTPSTTTHNVLLEIIWTLVPVIILIVIAVPSFKLLYYVDRAKDPEMTLKVTGYQWYWGYEYPDQGGVTLTANILKDDEIDPAKGQIRLLSTDNPVVVPVDTTIQVLVTAQDVLHSFAMPNFGIKMDAVPGRINETWMRIEKPGVYYGQCSELCGINHAFMPIEIHAVSKEDFAAWIARQQADQGIQAPADDAGANAESAE
ncbi:cytochrome c oxidase subunit II [Micavibrio aeruginosavorus]|uniref:cytochrome c oxidase subunit II n=1 Tax=Micavibrio aeruginosavorus TaxID=349221 RepID=UPI003F4AD5F2